MYGAVDLAALTAPQVRDMPADDKYIRALFCFDCRIVDELPPYDGPAEYDYLLMDIIERKHTTDGGTPHVGTLARIPVLYWIVPNVKKEIISQVFDKGTGKGLSAFDADFYDTRNQFYDDAMSCYQLHRRPAEGCPDYKSEKKRVMPKTAQDRKDAGLKAIDPGTAPQVFICDFCPAKAHYQKKFFHG